ncbi:ArsR/SmtB family transcription factor [Cohnella hashimotonis]|uniref:Metalloregulator ArsR/SmtB family transcription factor n=1 Tax=Cohnella hashimotonis TaxID=2826895 RepID=A0ABT6TQ50_9BACL|nr:metalloregulator ArsR/SmtB family transcription factor [Cohnella hashimotonis]MDI4648978.1 metalloregulator ArsR/SmtB family transcription factor [Cohnella hashimotonis]
MNAYQNIVSVASLIGDPSRAKMLDALMGGQALPAGELAYIAGVSPQTASAHLSKLVNGKLLMVESQGRHRYYRLANAEVAQFVEMLEALSPARPVRSLRQSEELIKVRHARTCYDHLAGRLGVALTNAWLERSYLSILSDREFDVTDEGAEHFLSWGVDLRTSSPGRRVFAKRCLDWSERYHHVGGYLGARVASAALANGWVERVEGTRALRVTERGRDSLRDMYGMDWQP